MYRPPKRYSSQLYKNCSIGLLGGSFDPAHQGHVDLSLAAIKQFKLDAVWWLVSPQNPLKSKSPKPLADRIKNARSFVHPRIVISDLETQFGTRYTIDTIRQLKKFYPHTKFIFLIGSDNWPQLRFWKDWRALIKIVPFAVFPRPPHSVRDLASPTGQIAKNWTLGRMHMNPLSSTKLRSLP